MQQIINEDGEMIKNLEEKLLSCNIIDSEIDYHIVSIIGCQSSGKSTLLNLLFGTKFEVMDESKGRQQTTQGIHVSRATDTNILIFDVEGCDSRERGDSDALFERKSALFSIAMSEVVVVNMWESDIGRYNAANIPLFRIVFDVNLQLFKTGYRFKPRLLFVIRDSSSPDFGKISEQIKRDMSNIWKEISKPEEFSESTIEDFFELQFFSIGHKVIEPEKFNRNIESLKRMFSSDSDVYILDDKSDKMISGSDIVCFVTNVWDVIGSNKELDIPSQRKMLSQFKCDEALKCSYELFTRSFEIMFSDVNYESSVVPNLHGILVECTDKAILNFKTMTYRYNGDIAEQNLNSLQNKLCEHIKPVYDVQMELYIEPKIDSFITYTVEKFDKLEENGNWESLMAKRKRDFIGEITNYINEASVLNVCKLFDTTKYKDKIDNFIDEHKTFLVKELYQNVFTDYFSTLEGEFDSILKESPHDMWDKLRKCLSKVVDDANRKVESVLRSNVENIELDKEFQNKFEDKALEIVKEAANYVMIKMKSVFNMHFKHDEKGRPRVWRKSDNINAIYEDSLAKAMSALQIYARSSLVEPNHPRSSVLNVELLTEDKINDLKFKFNEMMSYVYDIEYKSYSSKYASSRVANWAIILLIILNYRYIFTIMMNPFLLLVVLVLGFCLVLKNLGLFDVVIGKLIGIDPEPVENVEKNEKEHVPPARKVKKRANSVK